MGGVEPVWCIEAFDGHTGVCGTIGEDTSQRRYAVLFRGDRADEAKALVRARLAAGLGTLGDDVIAGTEEWLCE